MGFQMELEFPTTHKISKLTKHVNVLEAVTYSLSSNLVPTK